MMQKALSLFRMVVGLAYLAVAVAVFFSLCVVLLPSRRWRIAATNVFGHITGRFLLWLTGVSVTGNPQALKARTRPAIYVSNHTSITDIWLGIAYSPLFTCGMAKKEVVYYPFFGQLYWISGHLRVDRSNRFSAMRGLKATAELVKRFNLGMWIWAEGTRSRDGKLQPLKKGFGHMAIMTGLPIVPVVVRGAHRSWQKNELLFRNATVDVMVLPEIPTDGWTTQNLDEKLAEVHAAINAALPEEQRGPEMVARPPRKRGSRVPMPAIEDEGEGDVTAAVATA